MPFWYAVTLLLSLGATFFAYPAGTAARCLGLVASGLFAASIVYTVLLPVPINNQVTRWRPESLPGDWRQLRRRWDKLHALRVVLLLVALVVLVASGLVVPRGG